MQYLAKYFPRKKCGANDCFNFVKMHWVLLVPYYFLSFIKFDTLYDTFLSPFHFTITKTPNKPHNTTDSYRSIRNERKGRRADGGDVPTCTSRPAQAVTVSPLWCDGQIPTVHRTSPWRSRGTNFWQVTSPRIPSTLSRYGVTVQGNVTSAYPPLLIVGN
jgi:hypothetical protein